MSLSKAGVVFFVIFVGLSALLRMIEGAEFSTEDWVDTLVIGAIAAVLFAVFMRLDGKHSDKTSQGKKQTGDSIN